MIWCNFSSPALELVSNLNITPPDTQPGTLPDFPFPPPPGREVVLQDLLDQESLRPVLDLPEDRPPHRGPPHRGPPGRWWQPAPLARSGNYEWLRAASRRPFIPQPHITVFPASLVTFYHPRLTSLAPTRVNHTMTVHRAWAEASDADVQSVLEELDKVLLRSEAEMQGSGVDWQGLARDVIWGWADRIAEMDAMLSGQAENATEVALRVRALAYTPLSPYMEPGTKPGASGRELFDEAARARCESSATGFAKGGMLLTVQEQLLRESINVVMRRLCDDFGALFVESWDVVATARSGLDDWKRTSASGVRAWQARVRALVAWLDWPAWLRCEEVCGWEVSNFAVHCRTSLKLLQSVCTVPVWPIAWVGWGRGQQDETKLREQLRPKCMSLGDMEWP